MKIGTFWKQYVVKIQQTVFLHFKVLASQMIDQDCVVTVSEG